MPKLPYPPSCYNETLNLRVPFFLWLIIFWSIHHALFLALGAGSKSPTVTGMATSYALDPYALLSNLPGLLVLGARINRRPEAGSRTRWIWQKGRTILILGLFTQLGTLLFRHWKETVTHDGFTLIILSVTVGALILLFGSRRIKDVFDDFPSPELAKKE